MKTWSSTFRLCLVAIVFTSCAIAFMMVTATNPSADDFWKAMGMSAGGVAAYMFGTRKQD